MFKAISNIFMSNYDKNVKIYKQFHNSFKVKNPDTINTTLKTYDDSIKLFFKWLDKNKGYYILSSHMINNFSDIVERKIYNIL